ncbi:MAG: glycosyltransferase family 2 protein [Acidobacteria bacterium]|nr:glycosyltransferase family 2 protein [Acidobacteriota bacterium]
MNSKSLEPNCCVAYSVVVPVYNESQGIDHCVHQLIAVMESLGEPFELVFVDDGSVDPSLSILARHCAQDPRIKVISLSRNFGHQAALFAGLQHARGKAVISMDADLQHPPELVKSMVELWRQGNEVVYTVKQAAKAFSPVRRFAMWCAYSIIRRTTGLQIAFGQSDFRLLDRAVVDVISKMPEQRKFLRGLVSWVGFKQVALPYELADRYAGSSSYSYWKLFRLFFDGIFSFSIVPLRTTLVLGFLAASLALFYAVFSLTAVFLGWRVAPPGWLSTTMVVLFLGGAQLIGIGLVGEYLGRVYEETQQRPVYIVRRRIGFDALDDQR